VCKCQQPNSRLNRISIIFFMADTNEFICETLYLESLANSNVT
jgi:hypothetical protein